MELLRQKNVATYIFFPLVDADGDFVTSAGSLDSEIDTWNDGAAPDGFTDCSNEASEIGSTGWYYLSLTQGEMNYDYIAIQVKSSGAKTQGILIRTMIGDPSLLATVASGALVWSSGTRALTTPNDYKADVSGLATESNASTNTSNIQTNIDANETKIDAVKTDTGNIDTKTTNLPGDPASETNVNANETKIDAIKTDTGNIDTKTTNLPGDPASETNVDANESKIDTAITDIGNVWSAGSRSLSGTIPDFDALDTALDSAHGAGSWLTGGGGSGISIQTIPSIPKNIDLANTKTVRIALYVIDQSDDLPTTGEITPGTIKIDRSADAGTSWTTIRNDVGCSEHAGGIYYDEVFSSGNGYASADMIRITFKGQKVTIGGNDFEITGSDGMVFITRMDSGLSGGGPSAGDIADAVWNEPIADHTTSSQFGGKNQKVVPSETLNDYKADVSGLATESNASTNTSNIQTNIDANETKIDNIKTDTGNIDTKTTNLPGDPASETNVDANETKIDTIIAKTDNLPGDPASETNINANETKIDNIIAKLPTNYVMGSSDQTDKDDEIDAIKAKTDNLPGDPASETNVNANETKIDTMQGNVTDILTDTGTTIPGTITTLQTDLDNPAQYKANVSALATESNATSNKNAIITEVDANESKIDTIDSNVDSIKTKTDNLPADTETELVVIKGLLGYNSVLEFTFDENNDNISGKLYLYNSKANTNAHVDGSGLQSGGLFEFTLTSSYTNSFPDILKKVIEP